MKILNFLLYSSFSKEIPTETIEKIVGDMDTMFKSSISGYKEIKAGISKTNFIMPEPCRNMNSFKNVAQCGQTFVEDVYATGLKSIIATFNNLIGDTSSVQESLDKLNTNFDQLVLEMGGDIDENTKIKIEKAKIAISSLVDFTIEDKNLFAGIPSSIIKVDDIIWESAEESVQITDALLAKWGGRYTPAARKSFDLCRGENETIPKDQLSRCGEKLMEDLKISQKTSLMTDFLQFSFDKFDADWNGELDFQEFEKIFANFIATTGSTMIKLFDKNGNGILDKAEIVQILKELGKFGRFQADSLDGSDINYYIHPAADFISSFLVTIKETISKSEMTNMTAKVITRLAGDYYDLQMRNWTKDTKNSK
ncbi:Oidioi.mRNA.OKI2018_I69.chr1.g442.t1.cds [Oikopleura dioica]|uniref:Oidioi.mRNA.OKI2018_I69.chr1.g440.t1.cds n=1 Tax=Oikopleura dioica TaxID=34765 RepID=A0ABN7SQ24_OIKDI|nr:Oidioi.mRNA.OKI2018_I69.chr1.g440.t1.cds [Oikopleura dioica]CAG5102737.1 Oidioi.mRNA.OKI2018_I69.chr1.g442.t1.cds [Oikopleura dioica]